MGRRGADFRWCYPLNLPVWFDLTCYAPVIDVGRKGAACSTPPKNPRANARGFCLFWGRSPGTWAARRVQPALGRVVELELDRMRGVLQRDDLFHLQVDIGIDLIVGKDIALRQEAAIGAERVQSLTQ